MAPEPVYIFRDFQMQEPQPKKQVCNKAYLYMKKFKFVKVEKRNPILQMRPDLREALVLRRKVHKLFDSLHCPEWSTLLESNGFVHEQFLVMRDCYLTFEHLNNPSELTRKLRKLFQFLETHV
jgi:hypothetical protein